MKLLTWLHIRWRIKTLQSLRSRQDDYNGIWENYTLTTGDIIVEAVYSPVEYSVVFKADGKEVGTTKYTVEDKDIVEPSVPVKDGYTGYGRIILSRQKYTVNAIYTPLNIKSPS